MIDQPQAWIKFLEETIPDEEIRANIQKFFGEVLASKDDEIETNES